MYRNIWLAVFSYYKILYVCDMWNNHSDRLRRPEVLKIFLIVKSAYKNRKLVSLKQYDFYSQHSQIISKYFSDSCRKSGWLFQYTDIFIFLYWYEKDGEDIFLYFTEVLFCREGCVTGQVIALFPIREVWDFLFIMIQNGDICKKFPYMKNSRWDIAATTLCRIRASS